MMSFRNDRLKRENIPMSIVRLIGKINEYKGKQDLYTNQSPKVLDALQKVSTMNSTKASNSIEGIIITDKRFDELMKKKTHPKDHLEGEIAGYRDVITTIHTLYDTFFLDSNIILQLHRDLYKFMSVTGGVWKNQDNVIEEILPDGSRNIRFKPVSAIETPNFMDQLCCYYNKEVREDSIDPLILIGVFILDFLCIHPFNDGNGQMARLLTLLLLYQAGYKVGRYISLEKIVEQSKESYYETLNNSSVGWYEGKHDFFIWLDYLLGSILEAYNEFEGKMELIEKRKGNKSYRVEQAIINASGTLTKEDIRNACPDVSYSTISRVFEKLKEEGIIESLGKGRNAKWRRS